MLAGLCRNRVGSLTVDCSLIFTRYLDALSFDENDLERILRRHLMNGRLGQFTLGRGCYIYRDVGVESGKFYNDAIFVVLLFFITSAKQVMFSSLFVCLLVSNFAQKRPNGFA